MAAAAIARFFEGNRVLASLPGNNESDRAIQNLKVRDKSGADEIWITDLSWTQPQTAAHLKELSAAGARIFGSITIAPQSRAPTRPSSRCLLPVRCCRKNIPPRA